MNKIIVIILVVLVVIGVIFFNINNDEMFIKNLGKRMAFDIVTENGIEELEKYHEKNNINTIVDEYSQIILNSIDLSKNNIIKNINSKLNTDDWVMMGYDNFINKLNVNLNVNNTTLNEEINNMTITSKNNYDMMYYNNNIEFPPIIGPYYNKSYEEIEISLKKIILEFINNKINFFIKNMDTALLIPNIDSFMEEYIKSNPNYKDNFDNFSQEKLKPYINSELTKIIIVLYDKKIQEIKINITDEVKEILCKDYKGLYINGECTFNKENCDNVFIDSSSNILASYNNNNMCNISSQLGLKNLVDKNAKDNDIIYDSDNEKVNINSQYCINKGLEVIQDDCKFSKDKPILESILGTTLLNTINTKYDKKQYDSCNTNEIDAEGVIPDNLKNLLDPLIKKYGPIDKSLCIDKNYGCPADKELVNGLCYNKCPEGYKINPDNTSECYKLYSDFENNGKQHDKNIITKNIIDNPYLPKEICPSGYNYNKEEKKCIKNCEPDYEYAGDKCIKKIPGKWDGKITNDTLNKNAIYSPSKPRVLKCTNPNKPNMIDLLCYANCPAEHEHVPGAPYTCMPKICPSGYHKTGVNTCYREPKTETAWYTKGPAINRWVCPSGYTNHAGICWADSCPSGYSTSSPGFCMKHCDAGYWNTGGVCYTCPSGYYQSTLGFCRQNCGSDYNDVAGVCWIKRCPNEYPRDDGTTCWKDVHIYGKGCCCTAFGCCGNCPSGYNDDGCTCRRPEQKFAKSYVPQSIIQPSYIPESIKVHSTPASCPSDRDEKDGLCYPKCADGYWSSSATTCETNNCPSGYYKTKLATCQLDAHTINNPNIGIGEDGKLLCPDDTTGEPDVKGPAFVNAGICYPKDPPAGYQRHTVSLEQWTEKCPEGWTDTGWFCNRPSHSINKQNGECLTNYKDINNKCRKDCNSGYEFKDGKCIQKCPEKTINETETTCEREKMYIDNIDNNELPYKYRIKKRIKNYF
jgi:hypothetical protein